MTLIIPAEAQMVLDVTNVTPLTLTAVWCYCAIIQFMCLVFHVFIMVYYCLSYACWYVM